MRPGRQGLPSREGPVPQRRPPTRAERPGHARLGTPGASAVALGDPGRHVNQRVGHALPTRQLGLSAGTQHAPSPAVATAMPRDQRAGGKRRDRVAHFVRCSLTVRGPKWGSGNTQSKTIPMDGSYHLTSIFLADPKNTLL